MSIDIGRNRELRRHHRLWNLDQVASVFVLDLNQIDRAFNRIFGWVIANVDLSLSWVPSWDGRTRWQSWFFDNFGRSKLAFNLHGDGMRQPVLLAVLVGKVDKSRISYFLVYHTQHCSLRIWFNNRSWTQDKGRINNCISFFDHSIFSNQATTLNAAHKILKVKLVLLLNIQSHGHSLRRHYVWSESDYVVWALKLNLNLASWDRISSWDYCFKLEPNNMCCICLCHVNRSAWLSASKRGANRCKHNILTGPDIFRTFLNINNLSWSNNTVSRDWCCSRGCPG